MSTRILKITTGKLLAWGVALHSQAINAHLKHLYFRMYVAERTRKVMQRVHDWLFEVEVNATVAWSAAARSAEVERTALPRIRAKYGTLRASPPFGATPTVIDKRTP